MQNKNLLLTLILSSFVIVITAFIFSNSFADGNESHDFSSSIIHLLFLDRLFDLEIVQFVVRKAAHMIEFAVLGSCVMGLTLHLRKSYQRSFYGFSFFYVLCVAVMDEHIQKFSFGRTSSTSDVLLDFLGSMIGFFIVFLIYIIITRVKKDKAKPCKNSQV